MSFAINIQAFTSESAGAPSVGEPQHYVLQKGPYRGQRAQL
jgi:hypothetical protein